ncbi:MAG: hypothetical protein CL566_01520 [Alphaproteobacteria bacterium]|nr:hypothetical protein [Alphaproteobacteria bacterium]
MAWEWSSTPRLSALDCLKGPPLIVRSSRLLLLFLAAALVGLALIFGVVIFQLSRGPISLSFLTPLIARALNPGQGGGGIKLHDTILTWANDERDLDIRSVGLQFLDARGTVRATIPEMSVKFSARALLRGLVAPTSLELFGPRVRIVRRLDGTVSMDMGDDPHNGLGAESPIGLIEELLQQPDPDLASGYLSRVAVRSAFIEFDDFKRGMRIIAPRANIALLRDEEGISAEGSVVIGQSEKALRADLSGVYRVESGATDLGLVFSNVSPQTLASIGPALAPLNKLDATLEGTLTLSLDAGLEPTGVSVDLRAGPGAIDMRPHLETAVAFESGVLRARSARRLNAIELETVSVDLGGPVVSISGDATRVVDRWNAGIVAEVSNLPVNAIETYWPPQLQPLSREWITGNIRDGNVDSAVLRLSATVPEIDPGALDFGSMDGEIRFRDATVHYLRPLEPARNVFGTARFDSERFDVDIGGAALRDLVAETGRVQIEGLNGPPRSATIKIEVTIAGPVRDAFEILDDEPLGFISGFGIDPARTGGNHRTNAVFAFPLINKVKVDQIAVATASRLVDFTVENAAFGFTVSNGDLTLNVDREGMEASGTAEIANVPVGLNWTESFVENNDTRTRYNLRASLDEAARAALKIDTGPFLTGPIGLGLTYAVGWNDDAAGAAELDLTGAELSLDPFGWTKPRGVAGNAFVEFLVRDDTLTSIPVIRVAADDLQVAGAGLFRPGPDGPNLQRLTLEKLAFGGTDVFLNVEMPEGVPPIISIGGNAIDLRPVMDGLFDGGDDEDSTPAMQIVVSKESPLSEVRLGEETRLLGAYGTLVNDGTNWSDVLLRGSLSNGGRIFLRVAPQGEVRKVNFESDDAGGVLSALDWIDTIRGGDMRVRGAMTGSSDDETFAGSLHMQSFVLTEGPVGAQLLALTSLSGIADVLGGDGLTFSRVEVPFTLTDTEIVIKDGKARGADIGVLASGTIDRENDRLDLTGELAPAYTLNSLLADIPLIGTVLSGGADGIFAATFRVSGSLDDPDVAVNPLSVLTPGLVRRLLTGFGHENNLGVDGNEQHEPTPPEVDQ